MLKKVVIAILFAAFLCCFLQAQAPAQRRPRRVLLMLATAFAHAQQLTASGTEAHEGVVAADPSILPMGTRIRVTGTDAYDGDYLVTDTGAYIKGHHIDLYIPSIAEAKQFGAQTVQVEIRQIGLGKADARRKDTGGKQ